ncbi:MAG: efflux RND transporter periplasmic adaptor subunit [Gammaproteobacteria bacterium]
MKKLLIKGQKSLLLLSFCSWSFIFSFACPSLAEPAEEITVSISAERFHNLGVVLGKVEAALQIPLLTAPARVVVPPAHEYLVTASQSGLITKLNASIGDHVKQGDVLAELNSPDLLSLQRQYLKAESELQMGLLTYRRDKKLFEEGVISERRWQETQSQYNVFASAANEHRQLLEIAGMSDAEINRLKNIRRLSSRLIVLSPISGTVMDRMGVAGSRVDMLAPLYRLANLDELWLEISIPQERAAQVKAGDRVVVENIGEEAPFSPQNGNGVNELVSAKVTATIRLISQNVNPENQTVLTRAIVDGKQTSVRPGQRLNVQIIQKTAKPAFKVPNAAIAQNEGKSYIFIRNRTGFRVTPVSVIGKQGEESVISGDLTGSEEIAVRGAVALKANWLGLGSDE